MNAIEEQTESQEAATQIDFEYTIKEEDVILDLWSDKPLSDLQLAVLNRESVRGPLNPKYARTQHVTFTNVYICVLSWSCHEKDLQFKCKQLIRRILNAHN